jgi:serine/threonine protein kinase/nitrite reductase/ring-hydroxylating ferredoxin subunit
MQSISEDHLIGKSLGDYHIDRLLGRGKMSAVYLAQQHSLDRVVMVTTFTIPETLTPPAIERFKARFTQVGSSLVKLKHPHILPIYDCGIQYGMPYLVTSFVKGGSLAQILKQQPRFSAEDALSLLKQISGGLDFAHELGFVHGILNPGNILINNEQKLQITGFGLRQMLQMQGIDDSYGPKTHFLSIAGTFLGSPEYIAPECVLGLSYDSRADVYALGVMLFELLSGSTPFTGNDPLEVAKKRLQEQVPTLHEFSPEIPTAYDLIVYLALEREPEKRYKHAGEFTNAFERVLKVLEKAAQEPAGQNSQTTMHSQTTLPPTVNWFDEEILSSRKWQLMPPVVTGHQAAIKVSSQVPTSPLASSAQPVSDLDQVARLELPVEQNSQLDLQNHADAATDPFVWWAASSPQTLEKTPGTFARNAPKRPTSYKANSRRKTSVRERRQVVVGLLTGTAVVGILGIGGISFARFIESSKQAQVGNTQTALTNNTSSTSNTSTAQGATPSATPGTKQTPTTSKTPKAQPSPTKGTQPTTQPTPGATQTPQPTAQPTQPPPTPTPPQHTGTVIGHTSMATNSAVSFTNPADGQSSLLIHLGNGNFVACERACTHAGVPVNYNSGSGQLDCPAHGAVFNPANGFSHTSGPGNGPLASVSIRVNADGTITTG